MDELERLERAEQERLAKKEINTYRVKEAPDRPSMDDLHLPINIDYEPQIESDISPFVIKRGSRYLTKDYVYAKSIKKDNEYGIRSGEKFEVSSWNPFIIRSLNSGKYLNNPDPTLFTP